MPPTKEALERFEREREAYWRRRDELLKLYRGKWIAIVDGEVVAAGDKAGEVILKAFRKTGNTAGFVTRVGYEDAIYRIRQASVGRFDYDYHPSMPKINATMSHLTGVASADAEFIVDTGADLTVIRSELADEINLWNALWGIVNISGISGYPEARNLYASVIRIAGHDIVVQVDCRDDITENILGNYSAIIAYGVQCTCDSTALLKSMMQRIAIASSLHSITRENDNVFCQCTKGLNSYHFRARCHQRV